MTEQSRPILEIVDLLRRWRIWVVAGGLMGGLLLGSISYFSPRLYVSSASFRPESASGGSGGLAGVASTLGLSAGGGTDTPRYYAELLRSGVVLGALADLEVSGEDGVRAPLREVFGDEDEGDSSLPMFVEALRELVGVSVNRETGTVTATVTTTSPELSAEILEGLLEALNDFNVNRRQSRARAEREFAEGQYRAAVITLEAAEDSLRRFIGANRQFNEASSLVFEYERLNRIVARLQSRVMGFAAIMDEARAEEVKDIPVVTVIDRPGIPRMPEGRGTVRKGIVGGVMGVMVAVLAGLAIEGTWRLREDDPELFNALAALVRSSERGS